MRLTMTKSSKSEELATTELLAEATASAATPRRWGQWVASAVIGVLLAQLIHMIVTNGNLHWPLVGHYLFSGLILDGLRTTLLVTIASMIIGILLGTLLGVWRPSKNPVLRWVAAAYVWVFRGTPTLVQLLFWYNLAALVKVLSLGIPFGPAFASWGTNTLISPWTAAILGLGLHEAAYICEIVRAGIASVSRGQRDAAQSLGMTSWASFRRIVLPQAMRFIIPPTGTQVINMAKTSSLVSVISLADLLYSAQTIYNSNFQPIPLLIVVSIWYLAITTILSIIQRYIERYWGRAERPDNSRPDRWRVMMHGG